MICCVGSSDVTCTWAPFSLARLQYTHSRMSRRSPLGPSQSTLFPTLPSTSVGPVPLEALQHLEARQRRRISLRPHRLSVSSVLSKSSSSAVSKSSTASASSRSKRRKRADSDTAELPDEPDCVIRTDVHVGDTRNSDDEESKDIYEWAVLYENQRGYVGCFCLELNRVW